MGGLHGSPVYLIRTTAPTRQLRAFLPPAWSPPRDAYRWSAQSACPTILIGPCVLLGREDSGAVRLVTPSSCSDRCEHVGKIWFNIPFKRGPRCPGHPFSCGCSIHVPLRLPCHLQPIYHIIRTLPASIPPVQRVASCTLVSPSLHLPSRTLHLKDTPSCVP